MATTDKRRYTIPMLDRALRVLELLAPAPDGLSIAELSRQLAAPKSSVFNILATWAQRDYARVVEPTGKYVLTAKLYRVGSAALGQLAVIRRQGYALDAEEDHVGIQCVDAPIRDHSGTVIAAVSVTAPRERLPDEQLPTRAALIMQIAGRRTRPRRQSRKFYS